MPNDRTAAAAKLTSYANIEHDQARQARAAADALFKPRLQTTPSPSPAPLVIDPWAPKSATAPTPPASAPATSAIAAEAPPLRVPRVLTIAAPPVAIPHAEPVARLDATPEPMPPRVGKIADADHRRIRALALYGVSIDRIAADYGVAASLVAPIVMQSAPAGQGSVFAWA